MKELSKLDEHFRSDKSNWYSVSETGQKKWDKNNVIEFQKIMELKNIYEKF